MRSHGKKERKNSKFASFFSPPRLSAVSKNKITYTSPPNFDLDNGWDFFVAEHRKAFWDCLREQDPVTMSPECKPFSILMNSNWGRMAPDDVKRIQTQGLAMWQFCVQVAEYQLSRGKFFWIEQPATASSWATHALDWLLEQNNTMLIQFDQCAAGLQVVPDKLSRKPTSAITNHIGIARELSKFQCSKDHMHQPLQGGLPDKAKVYPLRMVQAVLRGIEWQLEKEANMILFFNGVEDPLQEEQELGGEADPDDETSQPVLRAPQTPSPAGKPEVTITKRQKEMVAKLHVNLGHLPIEQMLSMLKAAGAKDEVREYVKSSFRCDVCSRQRRPIERKRATLFQRLSLSTRLSGWTFSSSPS